MQNLKNNSFNVVKTGAYLVKMVKSINKDLTYCLGITCWYTMTNKQNEELNEFIKTNWDKIN